MTATSAKLKEPSFLLASGNTRRMIRNLTDVLDTAALEALQIELRRNVEMLFALGQEHLAFAVTAANDGHWRQAVSRAYYGAYNIRRAVVLEVSGHFAMDVSDHRAIDELPDGFPDLATHSNRLRVLRDDRNLADYNHLAVIGDLVFPPKDAVGHAKAFRDHALGFLRDRGVDI